MFSTMLYVLCAGGKAYGELKDTQMRSLGEINEVQCLLRNYSGFLFCWLNKRCAGCVWCTLIVIST